MSAADQKQRPQIGATQTADILLCADCPVPCVGVEGGYNQIGQCAAEFENETELFRAHLESCEEFCELQLGHIEDRRVRRMIYKNLRAIRAALKELPEKDYSWMFEPERNGTDAVESEGQYE